jgi:hypothetical protein
MANSEHAEGQPEASTTPQYVASNMRLTQDQLAAAERTREFHVQKLQSRMSLAEGDAQPVTHLEH